MRKPIAVNAARTAGAFHPFEREKAAAVKTSSSTTGNNSNDDDDGNNRVGSEEKEKGEHSQRKTRRCWSPELHRRFLHALQQLGGSHGAFWPHKE